MNDRDQTPKAKCDRFLVGELRILPDLELHAIDGNVNLRAITNTDFSFKNISSNSQRMHLRCDYPPTQRNYDTGVIEERSFQQYSDVPEENIRYNG